MGDDGADCPSFSVLVGALDIVGPSSPWERNWLRAWTVGLHGRGLNVARMWDVRDIGEEAVAE